MGAFHQRKVSWLSQISSSLEAAISILRVAEWIWNFQITVRSSESKYQYRVFETWRDLRKPADFPLVKRTPVLQLTDTCELCFGHVTLSSLKVVYSQLAMRRRATSLRRRHWSATSRSDSGRRANAGSWSVWLRWHKGVARMVGGMSAHAISARCH